MNVERPDAVKGVALIYVPKVPVEFLGNFSTLLS